MKKLVITGATSFIGRELLRAAMREDWQIVAVIRRNSERAHDLRELSAVKFIELNMEEYHNLGVLAGRADCFVHLSWNGTRGIERQDESAQIFSYECGLQAVQSMINTGCRRVIIAGSQAEYGNVNGKITEKTPCNPNTAYGKYKYKLFTDVEDLCVRKGVSYREARIFSLYGSGDYENTLIMSLIDRLLRDETCAMTKGIQMWDYLYVSDAVEGILALCEVDCEDGVYNLASGDLRTLKEYVEELRVLLHSKSALDYGAIPYPKTGMVSMEPSIKKITEQTGWQPKVSFQEGIRKMITEKNDAARTFL